MQNSAIDVKTLEGIQLDWRRTKNAVDLLRHAYNQGRTKDKFTLTTRMISIAVLSLANATLHTIKLKNLYRLDKIAQDTTDILSGIRLLRRGNARQAISTLEPTTSCVLPEWQANARWFLALAYLKNNQKDKAREQLQALLNGQSDLYQQEAQALTNALK